jgi:hypothetical protein
MVGAMNMDVAPWDWERSSTSPASNPPEGGTICAAPIRTWIGA